MQNTNKFIKYRIYNLENKFLFSILVSKKASVWKRSDCSGTGWNTLVFCALDIILFIFFQVKLHCWTVASMLVPNVWAKWSWRFSSGKSVRPLTKLAKSCEISKSRNPAMQFSLCYKLGAIRQTLSSR